MAVSESNSLNDLHNMIGDQPTMSMQKRKVIRPDHSKGAKTVKLARTQKASHALQQEYQTPRLLEMAMNHIDSVSAKLNARKRLRNTVDDHFSADKKQTLAEEQSMQVTASDQYHLVEAVMFACESYLKDCTGFEGFILWALVDSNGYFEQPDRIEEPEGMERNDESFKYANEAATSGESDCCIEESNDESFKFVNEAAEPVHLKSAESVRPVYIERPWHASHHNAESVRPVYIKRPWHASHHKGHTSLRSSDRWANNWPKQDKEQCCIKSKLRQKYTTTKCKYPTSGWRKRARSEETTWTSPSTITLKCRPIRCFHGC